VTVEFSPVERLARRVCKALPNGRAVSRVVLESLVAQVNQAEQRATTSRKARRALTLHDGDFDKALELAVSMGWVETTPDTCTLTSDGEQFARKSRVGVQRRRSVF
jgi:hypothetical protein